jgi:polysaccharide export outer membrane protein
MRPALCVFKILLYCALMVGLASSAVAQSEAVQTERGSPAAHSQLGGMPDASVRLGQGDLIEVNVYNVPELTTKARVGSNGDVYLPLIDYVHVAGLPIDEAQEALEKRLKDGGFVKDPHVTILVDEFMSQNASVLGEVNKPGVYPVVGDHRLFDVISAAGGLSEKAGRVVTVTHRDSREKPLTLAVTRNLSDKPESNIEIRAGDIVVVHRADVIYVVGDVGHPSGFLMDSGNMTVLQAIAMAGGTNKTAKLSGTKIIRKGALGMIETRVELKKVLQARAPDMELQPNDILFVPSSTTKILGGRTLQAALQAAAVVSIVAVRP